MKYGYFDGRHRQYEITTPRKAALRQLPAEIVNISYHSITLLFALFLYNFPVREVQYSA